MHKSVDSGAAWTEVVDEGSKDWRRITCNFDCSVVTAIHQRGFIYQSTDGGITFTPVNALVKNWMGLSIGDDYTTYVTNMYGHVHV